jgi:UDP-2,3-diacylglucosamine pyrophosphatase LpxH
MQKQKTYVRSIFLSDFHIGHKGFDVCALLNFLRQHECDYLYLVGDIIDGWKMTKRWHWLKEYSDLIDHFVEISRNGTKIIYITGNHDERLRRLSPFKKASYAKRLKFSIKNASIHKTADDKRLIVLHGDQFDTRLVRGHVSRFSDAFYLFITEWLLISPKRAERIPYRGKMRKYSLAKALKKASKKVALSLMDRLESSVFRLVNLRGADGLICGHSHLPCIKQKKDKLYINTGAWMGERNTAITEDHTGQFSMLTIPDQRHLINHEQQSMQDVIANHSKQTAFIVNAILEIWPEKQKQRQKQSMKQGHSSIVPTPRASKAAE